MSRTINDIKAEMRRILLNNDDLFVEVCEGLDELTGILDDHRIHRMDEFDDVMCGRGYLEVIEDLGYNFDSSDDYFYEDGSIESTNDAVSFYKDWVELDDILDELVECVKDETFDYSCCRVDGFDDLCEEIIRHDAREEDDPVNVYIVKNIADASDGCVNYRKESTLIGIFRNRIWAQEFIDAEMRENILEDGCDFSIEANTYMSSISDR